MDEYQNQLFAASLAEDPRLPYAINVKNAALLYEVFQRVGALDIHFGLQQDVNYFDYPLSHRTHSVNKSDKGGLNVELSNRYSSLNSKYRGGTVIEEPVTKIFSVDEKFRSRLLDREKLMCGPSSERHSNVVEQDITNADAGDDDINEADTVDHHVETVTEKEQLLNTVECKSIEINKQFSNGKSVRFPSVETNVSEASVHSPNAPTVKEYNSPRHTTKLEESQISVIDSPGNSLPEKSDELMYAESLRISKLNWGGHQPTESWDVQQGTDCQLMKQCEDVTKNCLLRENVPTKRLRFAVWFERWLLPNIKASATILRDTFLQCSGGVEQYFTPLKLVRPNKKFNQVFLSSLEYAILKDDLTRSYFYITDDHKEHMMLRELDDFRRFNMRKRITFDEFCRHFHPYISRNPEDYMRNKDVDTADEALQRRALQIILQKNLYGLSIEKPNEFFNKQCILKPFQILEPIPKK
ncbi:uncharacterized protein BBOV_IV010170 [Babesia bovis T2Bo]|uniref:Uncharacterized protein n=1 Tax=Babesia bovis TaxID=5865 RepID=A7AS52_BABBO|nr:uncharacterized protein BBOV_IV010170 [Babesia bovis T2Bo]EDO07371.1 hypothetical protein BBOV_IV010170 [Babesia bovis T2Bo]|eukprot:XP_001610939.1 hypothetical protein [Babesia bovis T2Bo]